MRAGKDVAARLSLNHWKDMDGVYKDLRNVADILRFPVCGMDHSSHGHDPSKAWDRHEASRYPHQREWAGWMLSTRDESDIGSEAEHLDLLLDWLNDAKQPLAQIRAGGGQADARFFYEFLNQGGGASLTVRQMERLVDLGLEVSWDIYASEERQQP